MSLFPTDPSPAETSSDEPRLLTRNDGATYEPAAVKPVRSRRKFRLVWRSFFGFWILAIMLVFAAGIYLRHAMRANMPQIDGTLHVSGLSAAVTVTRDEHGVPSIQATSLDDVLFAQGYVTAQDRLWQMDALRRHAAGELAEILGSNLLAHDRTQRVLQIRAAADRALAVLPADQLHQLEMYARGVNAYIAQNGDRLPVEFALLRYKPAPWTPRDSLLVGLAMMQDLSTEFPIKMLRESLSAHLPPELLADLYPVGAWRDHPPGQSEPDLTSPRPEIEQAPLDESQSKLVLPLASPQDLLSARAALVRETCEECRSGSNNWAVAGTRSASGMPLVSNDMHLALGVPDIWYEAALHTADGMLDVTGLTLPGTPFVIVGRNAHVAWGFTALGGDMQDVYIEHLSGSGGSMQFKQADGSLAAVGHHREMIRVRGGSDVTLDVLTTTHNIGTTQIETPIITPLYPSEHRALSLAWTAYDGPGVNIPFLAANTAADGVALTAAFAGLGGPPLSLVYADDHNHIGFHAIGHIPIRGPALHHPIAAPTPVIPSDGPPPPASDEDESGAAVVRPMDLWPRPRLVAAAYVPQRKTARAKVIAKKPAPAEESIPEPAAPLGYTIGSPIPPVPVDALDPNAQWSGYIPYDELPAAVDPASGVIAAANARVTADGYPYAVSIDWTSPYRVERITRLLRNATNLTAADMLRTQMDVHSEFDLALAHRFAYALDRAAAKSPDAKRLQQAAEILRRWNGNVDADAAAPAIVAAARAELWPMLLVPQIAAHDRATGIAQKSTTPESVARLYTWGEQGYALEQILLHTPSRWLPHGTPNWNVLLTTAVDRGLTNAHAPKDLSTWAYGKEHPTMIEHPVFSATPLLTWLLGVETGSGPRSIGGDTSTVKASSRSFGPTERFTADLANADATTSNITTGQSGNPASPWYLDQLPHWIGGTTLPLPLHHANVSHTLVLQP